MTVYEKRHTKFEPPVSLNDCTEENEKHKWEHITIEVDGCIYCTSIRTKRVCAP